MRLFLSGIHGFVLVARIRISGPVQRSYIGSKVDQRWKHTALMTLYTCLRVFLSSKDLLSSERSSRKITEISCKKIVSK